MTRLVAVSDWTTISEPRAQGHRLEHPPARLQAAAGQPHRSVEDLDEEAGVAVGGRRLKRPLLLQDAAQREGHRGKESEYVRHHRSATRLGGAIEPGPDEPPGRGPLPSAW